MSEQPRDDYHDSAISVLTVVRIVEHVVTNCD